MRILKVRRTDFVLCNRRSGGVVIILVFSINMHFGRVLTILLVSTLTITTMSCV